MDGCIPAFPEPSVSTVSTAGEEIGTILMGHRDLVWDRKCNVLPGGGNVPPVLANQLEPFAHQWRWVVFQLEF